MRFSRLTYLQARGAR
ncbi:hypothetical protein E2C01_102510 [Portunus trituberculatus]|uniref:Uncharacterized protein n=1 Tax=Portunus trituberculatus TaxID=210409 RepID=A0A5B7KIM2_PORTR|nr:hypothetical protein [Portunus trituberculatus]